jgi:hypothetical protein
MAEAEKMRFYAEHYGSWDKAKKAVLSGLPLALTFDQAGPHPTGLALATPVASHETKRVDDAIAKFMAELCNPKARKREQSTIRKYKTLLTRLQTFCNERGLIELNQIRFEDLMDFRDSWPTGARATGNNINRLRSFYRFCLRFKWVDENLAKRMDCPEGEDVQAEPWEPEEFDAIIRNAEDFPLHSQQAATKGVCCRS